VTPGYSNEWLTLEYKHRQLKMWLRGQEMVILSDQSHRQSNNIADPGGIEVFVAACIELARDVLGCRPMQS
jgi:hypothetical protein